MNNILKQYIKEIIEEGYAKDKNLPAMSREIRQLISYIDPEDPADELHNIFYNPAIIKELISKLDDLGYEEEFINKFRDEMPDGVESIEDLAEYIHDNEDEFEKSTFYYSIIDDFAEFLSNTLKRDGSRTQQRYAWNQSDLEKFIEFARYNDFMEGNTTSAFAKNYRVLKNKWIIHYTKSGNMYNILRNGFRYGVNDPANLALTTHIQDEYKFDKNNYGVYVFGFEAGRHEDPRRSQYGDKESAILFKTKTAVVAHHYGDNEYQAISFSKDIIDIVGIEYYENIGGWRVIQPNFREKDANLPRFKDFDDAVYWVIKNYGQYKNIISFR
jgi:hypothetical protein